VPLVVVHHFNRFRFLQQLKQYPGPGTQKTALAVRQQRNDVYGSDQKDCSTIDGPTLHHSSSTIAAIVSHINNCFTD
jgi:hypothetical protein